jgi:hypothetical protein
MRSLLTVFSLVASACAYQILTPSNSSGWTTVGPNMVTWQRVSTDANNFTMVLVNQVRSPSLTRLFPALIFVFQDKTIMPSGEEILIATVDGTQNSIAVPAPSGGFLTGTGFQVNFVKDSQDLTSILAQSNQFSITQPNTSTITTSHSNTVVYVR